MSKEYSFSVMPSVSISRSRFARKSQHKTSFNLGHIIPIYVDEVLPGDTRSLDMAAIIRMSTPIAPIMDNIFIDYFAFYVPNRLVWPHWKGFMGENETSAGIPSVTYSIPYVKDTMGAGVGPSSLAAYMGLPLGGKYSNGNDAKLKVSALPFRAYALIYNEWFRNQNVIAPLAIQTGDADEVIVGESSASPTFAFLASVPLAAKPADYFTKALPFAQKAGAVTLPLGTTAPILASGNLILEGALSGGQYLVQPQVAIASGNRGALGLQNNNSTAGTQYENLIYKSGMVADLSSATAATINDLRYAFQLQKLLEKDALYGTRYWEILASHFGVQAPDASLQRPEYLGGYRQHINIDQVLSTADYTNNTNTKVGQPGAVSCTGFKGSIFTKSFTEHGYLFILAVARHDQTYAQGVNRMWSRRNRFDFYWPVFANLGAQEIKLKELYAQGTAADEGIFGYQEAWAEYRYKPSIASGLLNPSYSGSLDYWTLTNNFSAAPTLGKQFIEMQRNNLSRALVTSFTGPDFIADFYFEDIAVRPMPMYSIPGLIDHH